MHANFAEYRTLKDINYIISEYDGAGNSRISFNEFLKILIPAENRLLRKEWLKKYQDAGGPSG